MCIHKYHIEISLDYYKDKICTVFEVINAIRKVQKNIPAILCLSVDGKYVRI